MSTGLEQRFRFNLEGSTRCPRPERFLRDFTRLFSGTRQWAVRDMFAAPKARTKSMTSAKTEKQQNRFRRGVSGNPAGRPKGARNKTTMAAQALLDGEGEKLTRKAIEMANAGDTVALRLCLDRIIPTRRERVVTLDLPDIVDADVAPALAAIIKATASGELTPTEAKSLSDMIAAYATVRALKTSSESHEAETEAAAALFDQRLAQRTRGSTRGSAGKARP